MTRTLTEDQCVDPEDLVAFLRGRLPPASVRALEAHVARCSECRRVLSAMAESASVGSSSGLGPRDADSVAATVPLASGEEELEQGARVGRYIVRQRLGAGGMGIVYAAYDSELDRQVALKLLRGDAFAPEHHEHLRDKLRQEAQSMARLAHPNVVTIYDVGSYEDRIFISMELVDGLTLAGWLRAQPRRWREIVAVFRQAGSGLAAAHAAGLVHCDFKPENVLIGHDQRVRVSDFGLARIAASWAASTSSAEGSPGLSTMTAASLLGTPLYMSPEQYLGLPLDHRSDQFSFCVALSIAITGEHPFDGHQLEDISEAVLAGRLRPAPRPDPMPAHIRQALRRGLAAEPEDRHPSMNALLAALARDPRRRLVWLGAGAGSLLAVALAGVFAYRTGLASREPVCTGSVRSWDGIWDAARARRLENVFTATRSPKAAASFATVKGKLDTYSRDWVAMHGEACQATRVRGDQPEELMQKRMVCLDARRRDASALLDQFEAADVGLVEKAPDTLGMLGDLSPCADLQALSSQVALPATAEMRTRVEDVRGRLARVKATRVAWGAGKGREEARAVAVASQATKYRPLEAETFFELALIEAEGADFKASRDALEKAIWAAEASGADELAARGWIRLMVLKSYSEGAEAALALRPRVTAVLERMGGHEIVEGIYHVIVAQMLLMTDRYKEARVDAEKGLRVLEKYYGPDDQHVADATDALGAIALGEGQAAEGVKQLERSLAIRTRTYGGEHPEVVRAMGRLGDALLSARRIDDAIAVLEKTLALLGRVVKPDHPDIPTTLYSLGLAYQRKGHFAKATDMLERAAEGAKVSLGDDSPIYGSFLQAYGTSLTTVDRHVEAVAVLKRSLAILEAVNGRDNTSVTFALLGLAEAELHLGNHDQARAHAERAVAIWEKALGPATPKLLDALLALGEIEVEARRPRLAIPALERGLTLLQADSDPAVRALLQFNLARALAAIGQDPARSKELAREARALIATDPAYKQELSKIDAWLARPAPAGPRRRRR